MKARRVLRSAAATSAMRGSYLAHDVRDGTGHTIVGKGTRLDDAAIERLCAAEWHELHLIEADGNDLHEMDAGPRLARAAAGDGVTPEPIRGGHWPLTASRRGLLRVRESALRDVNRLPGLAVYTLFDGQVVDAAEAVGRAKIIPFVIAEDVVARAECAASSAGGLVTVRPFLPAMVGAVVQESLGERAVARFRDALQDKVSWFGSRLVEPRFVEPDAIAISAAIEDVVAQGASVVVVAGSRPMDPLDPAFDALARLGAVLERHGVPAHPGSLLWLARLREIPIVGMPSCGLFSQATVFDLVLPRILAGESVDGEWLARLGHGGFLTRDMAFRFPAYRTTRERGEVE